MIFNLIKHAKELLFDKTGTNLEADNVQDAITEINNDLSQLITIRKQETLLSTDSEGYAYLGISDNIINAYAKDTDCKSAIYRGSGRSMYVQITDSNGNPRGNEEFNVLIMRSTQ